MAQNGLIGSGVKVGFATGSPHTWNKLEQILDVGVPTLSSAKIDITTHGINLLKRNMPGLQDVSDTTVKMLRDPENTSPNQNALYGYLAAQTDLWWRIEIPAQPNLATTTYEAYEFMGRVADFKPAAPIAGRQELDATIMFDGTSLVRYAPMASQLG